MNKTPLIPLLALALVACGPSGNDPEQDTGYGSEEDAGSGGEQDAGSGGGDEDAGAGGDEDAGAPDPQVPPADADALFAWLQTGAYEDWSAEPAVHPSDGPHGGDVRTYFNSALEESLLGGGDKHPVGAVSVKELYDGDEVEGWAVMIKTVDGYAAETWYWYEIFSTTDGSRPVASSNGTPLCSNCHGAGVDHVLSTYRFE